MKNSVQALNSADQLFLLSEKEAAEFIYAEISTFRRLARAARISPVVSAKNGCTLFKKSDIEDLERRLQTYFNRIKNA